MGVAERQIKLKAKEEPEGRKDPSERRTEKVHATAAPLRHRRGKKKKSDKSVTTNRFNNTMP